MAYVSTNYKDFNGEIVGNGQCVPYVQLAANVPATSTWKRGDLVKDPNSTLAKGTAIATFGENGNYENKMDGSSHAAIYDGQDTGGIWAYDQWKKDNHVVQRRKIRFKGGVGFKCDDGDQFYVIEPK